MEIMSSQSRDLHHEFQPYVIKPSRYATKVRKARVTLLTTNDIDLRD